MVEEKIKSALESVSVISLATAFFILFVDIATSLFSGVLVIPLITSTINLISPYTLTLENFFVWLRDLLLVSDIVVSSWALTKL